MICEKPEDRVQFPIDNGLIAEAQTIGNGAYVHDINCCIGTYRSWVRLWSERWESQYWYKAVEAERTLRGTVAAAKLGRPYHAPWATRKA